MAVSDGAAQVLVLCGLAAVRATNTTERAGKSFSLFSIVQFPNQQCTSSSSSSTYGTCFTSSECSAKEHQMNINVLALIPLQEHCKRSF